MKLRNLVQLFVLGTLTIGGSQQLHAIARYKAAPLNKLADNTTQSENSINFNYRIFNRSDCRTFLGRDRLMDKGYRAIQISITNNSDQSFELSLADFSFPYASCFDVTEQAKFNTTKRIVSWCIPGIFIWPFLIPGIIEAIEAPKANDRLFSDYESKALTDQVIKPFSSINGVIFVTKKQFDRNFSFQLTNVETNQKIALSTTSRQITFK